MKISNIKQRARLYVLEHDGTTTAKVKEHKIFPQFRKAAFKTENHEMPAPVRQ